MSVTELRERLSQGSLVLMDGGFGTELPHYGVETTAPLWSAHALLTPEGRQATGQIHGEYGRNGAQLNIAGTFRTMPYVFAKDGRSPEEARHATLEACRLAHEARIVLGGVGLIVAGSTGPLGDCYTPSDTPELPELRQGHIDHAENLAAARRRGYVDLYLAETMITVREIKASLQAGLEAGFDNNIAVSFCCDDGGDCLKSGERLAEAVIAAEGYDPVFIGINCVEPEIATRALRLLASWDSGFPLAVYAQGGHDFSIPNLSPAQREAKRKLYLEHVKEWRDIGAQVIGGCCGTTPQYIADISRLPSQPKSVPNALNKVD